MQAKTQVELEAMTVEEYDAYVDAQVEDPTYVWNVLDEEGKTAILPGKAIVVFDYDPHGDSYQRTYTLTLLGSDIPAGERTREEISEDEVDTELDKRGVAFVGWIAGESDKLTNEEYQTLKADPTYWQNVVDEGNLSEPATAILPGVAVLTYEWIKAGRYYQSYGQYTLTLLDTSVPRTKRLITIDHDDIDYALRKEHNLPLTGWL
jgi:hypothetical protein